MIEQIPVTVLIGYLLDLIFGDPRWIYHPVRIMGNFITTSEKGLRRLLPKGRTGERIQGIILVLLVLLFCGAIPYMILLLLGQISVYLQFAVQCFFCYQILATKSLKCESMKVYQELQKNDISGARKAVSMIVGRDTAQLSAKGITKAAVETIAENTADGVIAPLFYMMIGGPVAGFLYKGINTMDSMVGYKNEKYQFFGTAAAFLDDVVNYIPARISGLIMAAVSPVCGLDVKGSFKIYFRDRRNHASPNSAQTEAAMAGALQVQLAGDAVYFGKLYKKPFIGDAIREIEPEDIRRANQLLYATSAASAFIFFAVSMAVRILVL
ncbi:MAG: adenosylcobinamide-phosphate synthase CbiB [Lachnospiraceae bacterium]